ncbi:hypothetical protein ACPFL9_11015 [Paenarthrobacter sp. NyZ202]|uniref:hypothetical protein n=1 Tax=Paenarthrobacter sp. NyZ202 TaxID=3402689 RepID=UPI003CF0EBAD
MDDNELNAALRAYSEAQDRYTSLPAPKGAEPALPAQAQAAITKLRNEAYVVPIPGGPIQNYDYALRAWAAVNHPDIDAEEIYRHVLSRLSFEMR